MSFAQIVELRQFKYDIACMQDTSSKQYCLDVERAWDISALVASNTVKWPNNTYKIYPDFSNNEGLDYVFPNGTSLPLEWIAPSTQFNGPDQQNNATVQGNLAGPDWYYDRSGVTYSNHGYHLALNWDEYPTQIQCSSCFLQKFEYGITSPWGNIWDEMTSQIWANIQENCGFTKALVPANNFTGTVNSSDSTTQALTNVNLTNACVQYVQPLNGSQSAMDFAARNNFSYSSLSRMNGLATIYIGNLVLCAPARCQVQVVSAFTIATTFVASQASFVLPQFLTWNPYLDPHDIQAGEAVCVG